MKRQYPFVSLPPGHSELIRELVTYRAHIDTISALLPHPSVDPVARLHYSQVPDKKTPRGSTASIAWLLSKTYANKNSRLALNQMFSQFDDLRKSGFSFQESVVFVYRGYAKRTGHLYLLDTSANNFIRFEHFYCIVLQIETKKATLVRCTCCGSRNLLTKLLSSQVQCVFCRLGIKKLPKASGAN